MKKHYQLKYDLTNVLHEGSILSETQLLENGVPAHIIEWQLANGWLQDVQPVVIKITEGVYIESEGDEYFTEHKLLQSNPYEMGSKQWHDWNNGKGIVKIDQKIFSYNDVHEMVYENSLFNNSPFANALANAALEVAALKMFDSNTLGQAMTA